MSMITVSELITREGGRERRREGDGERELGYLLNKILLFGSALIKAWIKPVIFLFTYLPHFDQNKLKRGGGREEIGFALRHTMSQCTNVNSSYKYEIQYFALEMLKANATLKPIHDYSSRLTRRKTAMVKSSL